MNVFQSTKSKKYNKTVYESTLMTPVQKQRHYNKEGVHENIKDKGSEIKPKYSVDDLKRTTDNLLSSQN